MIYARCYYWIWSTYVLVFYMFILFFFFLRAVLNPMTASSGRRYFFYLKGSPRHPQPCIWLDSWSQVDSFDVCYILIGRQLLKLWFFKNRVFTARYVSHFLGKTSSFTYVFSTFLEMMRVRVLLEQDSLYQKKLDIKFFFNCWARFCTICYFPTLHTESSIMPKK